MKIAFFGTHEFSKNILSGILRFKEINIVLVVSQPDKPIGREKEILLTPIKLFAEEKKLKVLQPIKLKNNLDFFEELKTENLDFIVVVAYGKIIPKEILEIPKYGCINLHGSLLPLYRGASPIQESIKNGDTKTGLTVMYMSKGMDEGDILNIKETQINETDKTEDIFKKFEEIGPNLLIVTLKGIIEGKIKGVKQDNFKATYCSKITKEDGKVDFNNSAKSIYDKFRAYYTWPGIYTYYKGKKLNIEDCIYISVMEKEIGKIIKLENKNFGVICSEGILILKKIKLEGKKTIDINSFINGNKDFLNYKF